MKYISLLGLVATVASGKPLEEISEIEEYKIAQMASDIIVEDKGLILDFKKTGEQRTEITEKLLDTDYLYAPFILFSFNYNEKRWSAEQADDFGYFKKILELKENEPSYRYAIIGAGSIKDTDYVGVKIDSLYRTLLVKLF